MHRFYIYVGLSCLVGIIKCFDNILKPSGNCVKNVCTFDWKIGYTTTMVYFNRTEDIGFPVVPRSGVLWKRTPIPNCNQYNLLSRAELSDVFTADGDYRMVYTINNENPGPSIVVYEGNTVVVNVANNLINEGITIHWHGIVQRYTPWMDGVAMVSQCPINPGESFQYRFKAFPVGTHWYHSHHGTSRTDGIAGSIIVLPSPNKRRMPSNTPLPAIRQEFIGLIQEWSKESSLEVVQKHRWHLASMPYGYDVDKCFDPVLNPDGTSASSSPFNSAIMNGKGPRFTFLGVDKPELNELPFETFEVERSNNYRFRFINAGAEMSFRISIDEHMLGIIAMDGSDVETQIADAVIISPGESVDVLVQTTAPVGNYWIRYEGTETHNSNQEVVFPERGLAILNYKGSTPGKPITSQRNCIPQLSCVVVNCISRLYPIQQNTECIPVSHLKSTRELVRSSPVPKPSKGDPVHEYFLNFHFSSPDPMTVPQPAINGRRFVTPSSPLQTYPLGQDIIKQCHPEKCRNHCACTHIIELPLHGIIQMVLFTNDTNPERLFHPVHLHGHHFHVVKIGYPDYEPLTGHFKSGTPDITCTTSSCTDAMWSDRRWRRGNIPGANFDNPPLKDTVNVPYGGYVVIRFRADNPGFWALHCHIQDHHVMGMSLVMKEGGVDDMAPLLPGFPTCSNFLSTTQEFEEEYLRESVRQFQKRGQLKSYKDTLSAFTMHSSMQFKTTF